jgi:hypothetical protein
MAYNSPDTEFDSPEPESPPPTSSTIPTGPIKSQTQPGNLVILPDGSKHLFPAGATPDQMHKALNLGPVKPKENWVDKLRPFISGAAGAAGAAGVSLIPGVGETGIAQVAADTQTYAVVDSLLKYLGASPPKSYGEALTGSEADAAINAVAGKLIGGMFKGAKALFNSGQPEFYKLAPTLSQGLERFGMNKLATIPKFLEDYGVPAAKAEALDRVGGNGFTQTLAHANTIDGRMAGTNSNPQKLYDAIKGQLQLGLGTTTASGATAPLHYLSEEALSLIDKPGNKFRMLDSVIGDVDKLSKVLRVGQIAGSPAMNVRQDLAAYQFMRMVDKASTEDLKGAVRFDPSKLSSLWNNSETQSSFDLLFGKQGKERVSEFFKDIAYTQSQQGANPALGKFLRYGSATGKFILGIGALKSAITSGNFVPLAGIAGLQVGASTVGRLLTNPRTAQIMTEMAKGTFKESTPFAGRLIGNALRNETVGLVSGDGSTTDGTIVENPQTGLLEFQPHR